MIRYGQCICKSLSFLFDLRIGVVYEIYINEDENIFSVYNHTTKHNLNMLDIYFKMYLTKEEAISLIKKNLNISDDNIVEYVEDETLDITCIKYKDDLIYLHSVKRDKFTTINIEICSNYLSRQKKFVIASFEDQLEKFCDLLKLMHK